MRSLLVLWDVSPCRKGQAEQGIVHPLSPMSQRLRSSQCVPPGTQFVDSRDHMAHWYIMISQ